MDKQIVKTFLVALPLILSACHGQDPFKRESNPIKAYPNTQEVANEPYIPGQKQVARPPAPAPAAAPKVKPEPPPCFSIASIQPQADGVLNFTEGVENTHNVTITLSGPQRVELDLQAERPTDSLWRLQSRRGNELKYSLTWKPTRTSPKASKLTITYNVENHATCSESKTKASLNLVVGASGAAAQESTEGGEAAQRQSLSFPDLKNKITFGDKFEFTVVAEDPSATNDKIPFFQAANYLQSSQQARLLNARPAVVSCSEIGRPLGGNRFEFVCAFDSNLIEGVDAHLNSGREVSAAFAITVVSAANGQTIRSTAQNINVSFPNVSGTQGATR